MKKIKIILSIMAMGILFSPQAQARDLEGIFKECGLGVSIIYMINMEYFLSLLRPFE
jgi:uncharacterized membrane protein